jgi:hypothetical protein
MATSPPTPADPGAPAPQLERLASVAAQIAAIDRLIGLARTSIRVFDVSLAETGWNQPLRAERLAAFLRASRHAKLQIIVHDPRWIETSAPRLRELLRRFSHAITLCQTGPEARGAADPLLIVDDRHYLHRFHIDHPRAELAINAPQEARPLVDRYDEIWATGEPGVTATTLGL